LTAQELAELVGVGRTSVIRAAQSLGYEGYPQLRVALAQEVALEGMVSAAGSSNGGALLAADVAGEDARPTPLGTLRARGAQVAASLPATTSALTAESVEAFLDALDTADRLLVVANGLSGPLGLALVMRLNAAGRSVETFADPLAQQIAARQLGPGSACIVFSGSGANRSTLEAMESAREGGAQVLAITAFARSATASLADVTLVVPPVNDSFHDELIHTSRAALMLVTEELVDLFVERRGDRGREARATALSVLAGAIKE